MESFQQLRSIGETMVSDRNIAPDHVQHLVGLVFAQTDSANEHYLEYVTDGGSNALFRSCRLRIPRTTDATNALFTGEVLAPDIQIAAVRQTYGRAASIEMPSPRAPATSLPYSSVHFRGARIDFCFEFGTGLVRRMVVDLSKEG